MVMADLGPINLETNSACMSSVGTNITRMRNSGTDTNPTHKLRGSFFIYCLHTFGQNVSAELGPPSQVMDTILLAMARGKKTSEAQIIRAIEKVQKPHSQLEGLYNDINELHKNHMRKKKRGLERFFVCWGYQNPEEKE